VCRRMRFLFRRDRMMLATRHQSPLVSFGQSSECAGRDVQDSCLTLAICHTGQASYVCVVLGMV
jgi:hypothetical protein